MAIFNKDMAALAERNAFFQQEVYRDAKVQIVLMNLPAGQDIGMEKHPADQTTFIVSGEGQAIVDGHSTRLSANHLLVIPKGAEHDIVAKGSAPLKLFSVYAPPAEPAGVSHKTKADAETAEEGFVSRAAKALKAALSSSSPRT